MLSNNSKYSQEMREETEVRSNLCKQLRLFCEEDVPGIGAEGKYLLSVEGKNAGMNELQPKKKM